MDQLPFSLTPHQDASIRAVYPFWPWVELGQGFQGGSPLQIINLPEPTTDKDLKNLVTSGRLTQRLLESDIDEMNKILVTERGCKPDASGNKHQQKIGNDENPYDEWSMSVAYAGLDNRGYVTRDKGGMYRNCRDVAVSRFFDHVLSVLESLPVGQPDTTTWKETGEVKWERPRTINATTYPTGPNIVIRMQQDRSYRHQQAGGSVAMLTQAPATHCVHQAIYNMFDGIIVVTEADPADHNRKHTSRTYIQPPKWRRWPDLTWWLWNSLHIAATRSPNYVGNKFAPSEASFEEQELFRSGIVSGRHASPKRAELAFYQSIGHATDLPRMKSFLNFVMFSGKAVTMADISVIRRCLTSRCLLAEAGKAPVWGFHETFQVGHWAFYALLAGDAGHKVATLLNQHKSLDEFGHRWIQSVTVFAADCPMLINTPQGQKTVLVKLPVLLWEINDFNEGFKAFPRQVELQFVDHRTRKHEKGPNGWKFPNIDFPRLAAETSKMMPRVVLPSTYTHSEECLPGNVIFSEKYDGLNTIWL